ncbi:hypothetical protein F4806DRAFT_472310 [Annulohypoxylon nitens]|nr:hypothetical protein F4806DRAFT_472310 [Annulohypoxylon nitens]
MGGEEWSPPGLLGYSADHLLDHLIEVDIEALQNSQPKKFSDISDEIFFLFRDSDALGRWYSKLSDKPRLIYQLFGKTDVCSCIREWIPEYTTPTRFSRSEARWLKQAKFSSQALLRPFAQFISKSWLEHNHLDGFIPIIFLDGYTSMNDQSRPRWVPALKGPLLQIVEKMSPRHIRQMATFGHLKRNILWHLHLGVTFMNIRTPQHLSAGIREFRRARRKHGPIWILYLEEAVGLYCLQLYREAIEVAAHALEQEEFKHEQTKCDILGIVRISNMELGDFESAIRAAEEVCKIAPQSPGSVFNMIRTYHGTGRFSECVQYTQSILNHEGLLAEVIHQNLSTSQLISITCANSGRFDLARDIFSRAAAQAEASGHSDRVVSANMALSNLYLWYYNDDEKAIESWESLAMDPLSTSAGVEVACALASLYYTKVTDGNEDKQYWVGKLKMINERLNSRLAGKETDDQYTKSSLLGASALLGRWYMEQGNMQKARLMIQPLIQIAVDELTDKDDLNDKIAYFTLSKGLICFGDRQNAEIACAFGYPLQKSNELQEIEMREVCGNSRIAENQGEPTRHGNRTTNKSLENAEKGLFYFEGQCDGLCTRRTVHFRSFSVCEICVDLGFCDECLQKLRDGKFPYRICDAKHPFVEVYPPKGLVTKVDGKYKVQSVEGGIVGVDEWLSTISRRWLTG